MKYFFYTIAGVAYLYGCAWLFNHSGFPWLVILFLLAGIGFLIKTILTPENKKRMKKLFFILIACSALMSCERVAPNYYGVLMENYGKNGKTDYTRQQGKVNTMSPGTELFQVPAFEQRADFEDRVLHLKASDNTEFTAKPLYSYKVVETRSVDVVFSNARLGSGDDFMRNLENNILEPHIYDLIKEESRKYITDTLMASGGSLKFETRVQDLIRKSFDEAGLTLITFSANLDFSDKVKGKIDSRNEVNTNISVLDQQIIEQRKKNELAVLKAEHDKIISTGITPQLLQKEFIDKWDGKTPLYGTMPVTLFKNTN